MVTPSTLTATVPNVPRVSTLAIDNAGPSTSVSLPSTARFVGVASTTSLASALATGASFTATTVIPTVDTPEVTPPTS